MVDTGGAIQVGALGARGLDRGYGDHTGKDAPLELSPSLLLGIYSRQVSIFRSSGRA